MIGIFFIFNGSFIINALMLIGLISVLSFLVINIFNIIFIDVLILSTIVFNIFFLNYKYINFFKNYNLIISINNYKNWYKEDLICFKNNIDSLIIFFLQNIYGFKKNNFKLNLNYNFLSDKNLDNFFLEKTIFLNKLSFLYYYYRRNENIWIDGFLFDFLQKKTADYWIRRFVISTGVLFIEFFLFDLLLKIYFNTLLKPLHYKSIMESFSTSEMLAIIIFLYHTFIIIMFSVLAVLSF